MMLSTQKLKTKASQSNGSVSAMIDKFWVCFSLFFCVVVCVCVLLSVCVVVCVCVCDCV